MYLSNAGESLKELEKFLSDFYYFLKDIDG